MSWEIERNKKRNSCDEHRDRENSLQNFKRVAHAQLNPKFPYVVSSRVGYSCLSVISLHLVCIVRTWHALLCFFPTNVAQLQPRTNGFVPLCPCRAILLSYWSGLSAAQPGPMLYLSAARECGRYKPRCDVGSSSYPNRYWMVKTEKKPTERIPQTTTKKEKDGIDQYY